MRELRNSLQHSRVAFFCLQYFRKPTLPVLSLELFTLPIIISTLSNVGGLSLFGFIDVQIQATAEFP
jgi:hypothetical protein